MVALPFVAFRPLLSSFAFVALVASMTFVALTSFAFIAGVVPLVLASSAGAEMRHAMGIAVFAGMLGVTVFGLVLTPVFYVALRKLAGGGRPADGRRRPADGR